MAIITRSLETVSLVPDSLGMPAFAHKDEGVVDATRDFLELWRGVLLDPAGLCVRSRACKNESLVHSLAEPDLRLRAAHTYGDYIQAGYEESGGTGMMLSVESRVLGYWDPRNDPAAGVIMDCFRDHLAKLSASAPEPEPLIISR